MNGFIWNSEKINENVGVQKTGMAEKVLWMVVYGLRAFHRNPGGKPDYRDNYFIAMFGKSLRSTFTKLASGMKEATNKTVSAIKHKGSVAEVPDEM